MFETELILHPLPHRTWEVMTPFVVRTQALGTVIVEAGFICDLNSMPRFLWWASTPSDYPEAGVVHDYLYAAGVPRNQADAVYREILTGLKAGRVRAFARFWALRAFGAGAYNEHRKHDAEIA